jgi:hypothetical protein
MPKINIPKKKIIN